MRPKSMVSVLVPVLATACGGCASLRSLDPAATVQARYDARPADFRGSRPVPLIEGPAPVALRVFFIGDAGIGIGDALSDVWDSRSLASADVAGIDSTPANPFGIEMIALATPVPQLASAPVPRQLVPERSLLSAVTAQSKILTAVQEDRDFMAASPVAFVWLGDNVYEHGVDPKAVASPEIIYDPVTKQPTEAGRESLKTYMALAIQAEVSRGAQVAALVPGNHDWASLARKSKDGLARVNAEAALVQGYAWWLKSTTLALYPRCSISGPEKVDVPDATGRIRVRLVFFDSEAVLQRQYGARKGCPDAAPVTPPRNDGEFGRQLQALVAGAPAGVPVIVSAHHPLATYGAHGSRFVRTLNPISHAVTAVRWIVGSSQDVAGWRNKEMRSVLRNALDPRPPLAYASGHEHVLQVIARPDLPFWELISGSSSKNSPVATAPGPRLQSSQHGYMFVDFMRDGGIELEVVEAQDGAPKRIRLRLRDAS